MGVSLGSVAFRKALRDSLVFKSKNKVPPCFYPQGGPNLFGENDAKRIANVDKLEYLHHETFLFGFK